MPKTYQSPKAPLDTCSYLRAGGAQMPAKARFLARDGDGSSLESLMWHLCFLFSLLIRMCSVYIVREQTEPWLVFHIFGNGSCVLLAVSSCSWKL